MVPEQASPRILLLSAWALAVALVFGAPSAAHAQSAVGAAPNEDAVRGDGGKIRIVINPTGTQSFPTFVLQKFGLDKKHGFELQIDPLQPLRQP